jgi:hypothetical protein
MHDTIGMLRVARIVCDHADRRAIAMQFSALIP